VCRRRHRANAGDPDRSLDNGVDGAKYLYNEVVTALTHPTPVTGE
jgi:hypothetical protein